MRTLSKFLWPKAPAESLALLRIIFFLGPLLLVQVCRPCFGIPGKLDPELESLICRAPGLFADFSPFYLSLSRFSSSYGFVFFIPAALGLVSWLSVPIASVMMVLILVGRNSFGCLNSSDSIPIFFYLTFFFVRSWDAWSVDALLAKRREKAAPSEFYGWPVQWLRVLFCLCYFLAALAKVKAGTYWFSGLALRDSILWSQETFGLGWGKERLNFGLWIARSPNWLASLSTLSFSLELAFPLALVWLRARYILVAGLIAFHVGIYLIMGIAFYVMLPGFFLWLPLLDRERESKARTRN